MNFTWKKSKITSIMTDMIQRYVMNATSRFIPRQKTVLIRNVVSVLYVTVLMEVICIIIMMVVLIVLTMNKKILFTNQPLFLLKFRFFVKIDSCLDPFYPTRFFFLKPIHVNKKKNFFLTNKTGKRFLKAHLNRMTM